MSISTNKVHGTNKVHVAVTLVLALFLGLTPLAPSGANVGEIIVDVVEGRMITGAYELPMADSDAFEKPIAIGIVENEVIVRVETPDGPETLYLGEGYVSLTNRAVPYVTSLDEPEDTEAEAEGFEICPVCERSTAFGYHKILPCGHMGCLKSVDHLMICSECGKYACNRLDHVPCEHCGVAWCIHVDIECEYTRNPAPTPFATRDPDGRAVNSKLESDGSSVSGNTGSVTPTWAPGVDYKKQIDIANGVTPAPSSDMTMP